MLKQHTSESSLNWHGLTWIGGTFESDTGGTFHSDMPGTFQSAADGTFVSAIDGTFQSDMSGTFGPMLSTKGLEFDTVVVLNAHRFNDKRHLYVALTRCCKQLIVISNNHILNPD